MKIFKYRSTPVVLAFWIVTLFFLQRDIVSQSFLVADAQVDISDGALIMREDYLGFYMGNQKIGYSQFVLKEDSDESQTKLPGKYYVFNSDMLLRIQALGMPIEVRVTQSGEVNEDLSMRAFRSSFESSGQKLYTLGTVEEDGLHLTSVSEGQTSKQVVDVARPVYHTDMIHLLIAREGLKVGGAYTYPIFDPLTMSKGTMTGKVESLESVTFPDGKTEEAYRATVSYKGMNTTVWIDKKGERFKEDSQVAGISFVALRETKEEATDLSFVARDIQEAKKNETKPQNLDLIESSRILTEKKIPDPNHVKRMEAKMIGVATKDIVLDDNTQFLVSENPESLVVAIEQVDYPALIAQVPAQKPPYEPDPKQEAFLKDELLVQSSSPQIREKALEITKDAENAWEASEAIADWLYKNIRKEMRATIPSAVEILASMRGDCNEHSTLFAALARSIGIPAKIAAGLVYQDDGFYYHAWNEVLVNGTWMPVDSTLNRIRMDAAHIKLAEGSLDSQTDIVNLIGQINVEILSFKDNS